jgi:hypothetical protein
VPRQEVRSDQGRQARGRGRGSPRGGAVRHPRDPPAIWRPRGRHAFGGHARRGRRERRRTGEPACPRRDDRGGPAAAPRGTARVPGPPRAPRPIRCTPPRPGRRSERPSREPRVRGPAGQYRREERPHQQARPPVSVPWYARPTSAVVAASTAEISAPPAQTTSGAFSGLPPRNRTISSTGLRVRTGVSAPPPATGAGLVRGRPCPHRTRDARRHASRWIGSVVSTPVTLRRGTVAHPRRREVAGRQGLRDGPVLESGGSSKRAQVVLPVPAACAPGQRMARPPSPWPVGA